MGKKKDIGSYMFPIYCILALFGLAWGVMDLKSAAILFLAIGVWALVDMMVHIGKH